MIDRIKNIFARLCIDDYLIRELTRESLEMYFVKKALDTKRSVKTTDYTLTVYRSFTEGECEYRGSSEVLVFPSMTDDEIEKKIADGYASATSSMSMDGLKVSLPSKCADVIKHPNAHFCQCHPKASSMLQPALEALRKEDFKDVAYFEPFYLKEFVATVSKKKLF